MPSFRQAVGARSYPRRGRRSPNAPMKAHFGTTRRVFRSLAATLSAVLLGGCLAPQVYPTLQERAISLKPGALEAHGIAFITPSTATGQEEDKQALALTFAEVLRKERPGVRCVTLAETLSAINQAGLADAYKRMYDDYRDTGVFNRSVLREVGRVTGARYVAHLKLQRFDQGEKQRLGAFGLRLVETKYALVHLFFQVWDSQDGSIVWEGTQELRYAQDTVTEAPVTFRTVIERTARDLIARLP